MVLVLLIIGFGNVASGALVHVTSTAIEAVVGLVLSLCLFSSDVSGCSFDTAHLVTLARLFVQGSA